MLIVLPSNTWRHHGSYVGDHVEMRVRSSPPGETRSGFGMLKSRRAAVPTDFDPATLVNPVLEC